VRKAFGEQNAVNDFARGKLGDIVKHQRLAHYAEGAYRTVVLSRHLAQVVQRVPEYDYQAKRTRSCRVKYKARRFYHKIKHLQPAKQFGAPPNCRFALKIVGIVQHQ
jgi:hypothetical protein